MTAVFVVCAAVGGTLLVWQLVMMLLGFGHDAFQADVGGGDFSGADFSHGLDGVHVGDFHTGDLHAGDTGGADHAGGGHAADDAAHHGPNWLAGVISFRTMVAAVTFFGLAGLAAQSAQASSVNVMGVALAAGVAALYGVYWLMRGMYQLRAEGNVRLVRAVGRPASVYLRIPGHNTGLGKVQINLQNRTMEYQASTAGEEIPTGATVTVVALVDANTVAVQLCDDSERNQHD
jgi:hypothetical protein